MIRKEFVGRILKVKKSKNKALEGIEGLIIDETKHLFVIEVDDSVKKVQKDCNIFQISFDKEAVELDGSLISVSPEDRIKLK
ncbi:MAG TPA: ribonuclease P protein subunit, partial [Candidatus Woesearchaeota archaeon]|nr:ribonuclease P protein subunit [Candidatus Woesearchaeota archaeon]